MYKLLYSLQYQSLKKKNISSRGINFTDMRMHIYLFVEITKLQDSLALFDKHESSAVFARKKDSRQKKRQRSSLLFGGQNLPNSLLHSLFGIGLFLRIG